MNINKLLIVIGLASLASTAMGSTLIGHAVSENPGHERGAAFMSIAPDVSDTIKLWEDTYDNGVQPDGSAQMSTSPDVGDALDRWNDIYDG